MLQVNLFQSVIRLQQRVNSNNVEFFDKSYFEPMLWTRIIAVYVSNFDEIFIISNRTKNIIKPKFRNFCSRLVLLPIPHICGQDVQTTTFDVMADLENTHTLCPATILLEHSDGSVDLNFAAGEGCDSDGIFSMAL